MLYLAEFMFLQVAGKTHQPQVRPQFLKESFLLPEKQAIGNLKSLGKDS